MQPGEPADTRLNFSKPMTLPDSATPSQKDPYSKWIVGVSIALPALIALLFGIKIPGYDFSFLPAVYATLNGITSLLLILAVLAIKGGNRRLHQACINVCIFLSVSFLILYVLYHVTSDPTPFGGQGYVRFLYYFILVSHILLSATVVPVVLFTYLRALRGKWPGHRALARITFPIWLYVTVTGVIVYVMIRPYYPS
jgi:putative membrane protein